jgi:DNA repair ATPase RecN
MRKHQIENAAYEVATQVRAVEDSIEAALAELAELQSRMVRARGVTRAHMVKSHAAFEKLAETTASLVEARGNIGHCHVALAEAQQSIPGLRTVAFGDGTDCPPPSGLAELRVVA